MARPQILIGNGLPAYRVFPSDDTAGVEITHAWFDKDSVSHKNRPCAVVIRVGPKNLPGFSVQGSHALPAKSS